MNQLKGLYRAVISTVLVIVLAGCAAPGPDKAFLQPLHEQKPRSILVVPVNNETIDVQAPTSVLATLPMVLGERGYYVFPVNTVKTLMENEGYYEPAEVHAAPPESLASMFGADTVLYVTIHEWTSQYMLISTTTTVMLSLPPRSLAKSMKAWVALLPPSFTMSTISGPSK